MNNAIECICSLIPNRVLITIPKLKDDMTYVVVGINDIDSDLPVIIVKKNKHEARATFKVPVNLVGSIIVNDFGNGKDKN